MSTVRPPRRMHFPLAKWFAQRGWAIRRHAWTGQSAPGVAVAGSPWPARLETQTSICNLVNLYPGSANGERTGVWWAIPPLAGDVTYELSLDYTIPVASASIHMEHPSVYITVRDGREIVSVTGDITVEASGGGSTLRSTMHEIRVDADGTLRTRVRVSGHPVIAPSPIPANPTVSWQLSGLQAAIVAYNAAMDARAASVSRWLRYEGGLWWHMDITSGITIARAGDWTRDDALAWDWTCETPDCVPPDECDCDPAAADIMSIQPYRTAPGASILSPNGTSCGSPPAALGDWVTRVTRVRPVSAPAPTPTPTPPPPTPTPTPPPPTPTPTP
jgi:hypothetical protein